MKQYKTGRDFADALGVNRGTMSRYLRRDDWPIHREPPWTESDRRTVAAWRAEALQEDRAHEAEPMPEPVTITAMDLATGGGPFASFRAWMGDLFHEQTPPDMQSLAAMLTEAYRIASPDGHKATSHAMSTATIVWLARRYHGQSGWWRRLADPPKGPPPRELVQGQGPLAHRRGDSPRK